MSENTSHESGTKNGKTKRYIVLSGKGGVGKSTVAVSMATALALEGKKVGLLDADLHGPTVAKMLGLVDYKAVSSEGKIEPAQLMDGHLRVMSVQFLLANAQDSVIWRGPLKHNVIKQFVTDTQWGDIDFLFVDLPPGTGDEPLSIVQTLDNADGALVITTPQSIATFDVRKSIDFCRKVKLPIRGIIENMGGFACPHCGEVTNIFGENGGKTMAEEEKLPFLGSIPIDPSMVNDSDNNLWYADGAANKPARQALKAIAQGLLEPR